MTTQNDPQLTVDPAHHQHFLNNPGKLEILIGSAGIRPTDDVVEVGAGTGTVARHVPACRSLTVIEYDSTLIPRLRRSVPHARVIQGDAFVLLPRVRCHVLLSSLPARLTEPLLRLLPSLRFRTAMVVTAHGAQLHVLREHFTVDVVAALAADDFRPSQEGWSVLLRLDRRDRTGQVGGPGG